MDRYKLKLIGVVLGILLTTVGLGTLIVYLLLPIIGTWSILVLIAFIFAVGIGLWLGAKDKL